MFFYKALSLCLVFFILSCSNQSANRTSTAIQHLLEQPIPKVVNPVKPVFSSEFLITFLLWSPLLRIDPQRAIVSPFIKNWLKSMDGTEWIFEIKPDLKWSDGSPLTSTQILASLKFSLKNQRNTQFAKKVKEIVLENSNQLIFRLSGPNPEFLSSLAQFGHLILDTESQNFNYDLSNPNQKFSGFYRPAKQRSVEDQLILEPNPFISISEYKISPLPVVLKGRHTPDQMVEKLLKGEGDFIRLSGDQLSEEQSQKLREAGFVRYVEPNRWWTYGIMLGKKLQNKNKKNIRQALLRVFSEVRKKYLTSHLREATGITPNYILGALEANTWKKAITTLPQLTHSLGYELYVFESLINTPLLRNMMKDPAIEKLKLKEIHLSLSDQTLKAKARRSGDFDLAFILVSFDYSSPDPMWRFINYSLVPGFTPIQAKALDQALNEQDIKKSEKMYQSFELQNISDPYFIPLATVPMTVWMHKRFDWGLQGPYDLFPSMWSFKLRN